MKIGFNLCPPTNKGCGALERGAVKLVRLAMPDAEIKPFTSGYTDEKFDIFLCIGGDNISYRKSIEFDVTRNALKNGIPTFGFGSDVSPVLGRYTAIPPDLLRVLCKMDELLVRSEGSQKLLEQYGIPAHRIPDLSWCLDPEPIEYAVPENTIAISAYQNIKGLKDMMRSLALELRANGFNVICLLETSYALKVADLDITPEKATWEQNITILKQCKGLITTGFHSAICGYKAGIPVLLLPVQEKSYWLAEELGLPKPPAFSSLSSVRFVNKEIEKLIDNPPKVEVPNHDGTILLLRDLFNKYASN